MTILLIIGILLILVAISVLISSFMIACKNDFNEGQTIGFVLITIVLTLIFGAYGIMLTNQFIQIILNNYE
jgi:hypothetical protein